MIHRKTRQRMELIEQWQGERITQKEMASRLGISIHRVRQLVWRLRVMREWREQLAAEALLDPDYETH